MKIHLKNQSNFNSETVEFYKDNFEIVDEKEADIIVVNDFTPFEVLDKIVACNATCCDHIKAKEVVSLAGEDLSDLTAVPELCLGMAIMLSRIFKREEIKGNTLGIIGFGRIGKELSKMAFRMGMSVWTKGKEKGKKDFIGYTDLKMKTGDHICVDNNLDDILGCDIISLHITADESNRYFIRKEHFKKMKEGAIFLNSARPWLVEEEGLKWALNNKLSACWTDFILPFQHPKLITTDHLGGTTVQSKKKSEMIIARKLKELYGRK